MRTPGHRSFDEANPRIEGFRAAKFPPGWAGTGNQTDMKLYLLRHGDAGEAGDPRYKDNERPLTPKGIQRTKQLAHVLREMEITMDAIVTSPLTRAKETAEIVVHGLKMVGEAR